MGYIFSTVSACQRKLRVAAAGRKLRVAAADVCAIVAPSLEAVVADDVS